MGNAGAPEAVEDQMRPKALGSAGGETGLEACNASLEFPFGLPFFPSGIYTIFAGPLGTRKKKSQLNWCLPDQANHLYFVYFSLC